MRLLPFALLFAGFSVDAFSVAPPTRSADAVIVANSRTTRLSPLFMGRAAAVRAATKSKTDAKKAKTNALYGKKLIMAVKQGGSPDPVANKMLADVIKAAKANNVPVDVSGSELKTPGI